MSAAAGATAGARRWRRSTLAAALLLTAAAAYAFASFVTAAICLHPASGRPPLGAPRAELTHGRVVTADGVEIAFSVLEPEAPPPGTVLLVHGLGSGRELRRMEMLRAAGLRTFAMDLRAHGESGGSLTSFGWHERADVLAAAAEARRRWPDAPLGAWGISMGGAAIAFAAEACAFDAVVLESVYATLEETIQQRLDLYLPRWIHAFLLGPRWVCEWRLGVDFAEVRPVDAVRHLGATPLLVVTGACDERASPDDARRLAAHAPDAEVLVLPGCGHEDVWSRSAPSFRERVASFFHDRLARAKPRAR